MTVEVSRYQRTWKGSFSSVEILKGFQSLVKKLQFKALEPCNFQVLKGQFCSLMILVFKDVLIFRGRGSEGLERRTKIGKGRGGGQK